MAVKVIKGGTRMVKKTVYVEEKLADKFLLELTQEEVNALVFVLGQRYGGFHPSMSTEHIYRELTPFSNRTYSADHKIIQYGDDGWKVVKKDC